jgi:murein DD-endopeptidase MepM/ murein hydrolase activator NlpD
MSQGFSTFHPGLDLATKYGTKINPIESGTVKMAGYSSFGYGFEIVIDHEDGTESLYAHLSKIEVKKGDTVNLNTEIGLVGSTGHSTGPHLHLEVHKNGIAINPLSVITLLTLNPR